MKKVLVINGPNLNMLGIREPGVYGTVSLSVIIQGLTELAEVLSVEIESFQSNHEGDIIDKIHRSLWYERWYSD